MNKIYLKELELKNYRNFHDFKIKVTDKPVIITGGNGVGKTNILEAISFIFPGRGIRNAKFQEAAKDCQSDFNVKYILESKFGPTEIISNYNLSDNKRTVKFNGSLIPANDLSKLTNIIWLTPLTNSILIDAPSLRRKFLDRIVYNFDNSYLSFINKYEYFLQERSRLLQSDIYYPGLLDEYETKIAECSLKILKTRFKVLNMLQLTLKNLPKALPQIILKIEGGIETDILHDLSNNLYLNDEGTPGDHIEKIRIKLNKNRKLDQVVGRASYGTHKSDFIIFNTDKNMLAKQCSTGEQKAILISLLIAQIDLCINDLGTRPIVLLDEVFNSLDQIRKDCLIDYINTADLQCWITATDLNSLQNIIDFSQHIVIGH